MLEARQPAGLLHFGVVTRMPPAVQNPNDLLIPCNFDLRAVRLPDRHCSGRAP